MRSNNLGVGIQPGHHFASEVLSKRFVVFQYLRAFRNFKKGPLQNFSESLEMNLFHGCFRDKLKNEKIHSIFDNKCFSMCEKVGSRSPSKDACRRASGRKCMFLQHAVVTFRICCAKPKTQATLHICYTHQHCKAFLTNHGGHSSYIMH